MSVNPESTDGNREISSSSFSLPPFKSISGNGHHVDSTGSYDDDDLYDESLNVNRLIDDFNAEDEEDSLLTGESEIDELDEFGVDSGNPPMNEQHNYHYGSNYSIDKDNCTNCSLSPFTITILVSLFWIAIILRFRLYDNNQNHQNNQNNDPQNNHMINTNNINSNEVDSNCTFPLNIPRLPTFSLLSHEWEQYRLCSTPDLQFPIHPSSFLPSLHPPGNPQCQTNYLKYPLHSDEQFNKVLKAHSFDADPLPECTLINPSLTLNLLNYVRYVQIPHLQANCSQFKHTGRCVTNGKLKAYADSSSDSSFVPGWVVFRIDESGGGFADRYKGLLSTFFIAVLTQRAFAIENHNPLPWENFYLPNVLPWLPWTEIDPFLMEKAEWMRQLNYMDIGELWAEAGNNYMDQWSKQPIIRMRHNANSIPLWINNHFMHPLYQLMGFDRTELADLDYYQGCFQQFLFRPASILEKGINSILTQLNRPLVSTAQPTKAYQQLLQFYVTQPRTVSPFYCAQIRMGLAGSKISFSDSEMFIKPSLLPMILKSLQDLIEKQTKNNNNNEADQHYFVYVTSDSLDYQEYLPKYFPSPPATVIQLPGVPIHVDKVSQSAREQVDDLTVNYLNTIVSFHLLGECDLAVFSRSGFGSMSQWRTRNLRYLRRKVLNESDTRKYADLYQIDFNGKAKIFDYGHVRGSGGRELEPWEGLSQRFPPPPICKLE